MKREFSIAASKKKIYIYNSKPVLVQKALFSTASNSTDIFFYSLPYYTKLGFPKTFNVIKNDTVI